MTFHEIQNKHEMSRHCCLGTVSDECASYVTNRMMLDPQDEYADAQPSSRETHESESTTVSCSEVCKSEEDRSCAWGYDFSIATHIFLR